MIRRIAFTGTGRGMTSTQHAALGHMLESFALATLLGGPEIPELHHGDSGAADATAAKLARDTGFRVIAHPEDSEPGTGVFAHETREPLQWEVRTRNLVLATDLLVVAPWATELPPSVPSGVWLAVRLARTLAVPQLLLTPDPADVADRLAESGGGS